MIPSWSVGVEPNWRIDPRYVIEAQAPWGDEYAVVVAMRGINLAGWHFSQTPIAIPMILIFSLVGWAIGAFQKPRKVAVFHRDRYTVPRRMRVRVDSAEAAIELAETVKKEIERGILRWSTKSDANSD